MLVRWFVFIHVLSAITFFLSHGASVAMVFKLRKETDFARIRAMLDLSATPMNAIMISFILMGVTGLIMPFMIHIWNRGWIWLSIVLMLFVFFWMFWVDERTYKLLRKKVGLPYMLKFNEFPAEEPASQDEVFAHIKKINVTSYVIIGYVIPAIVLWLMVFKPF